MNYLPTCTSTLVVQHLYQVSFKSMQGCRRSWEDKLKCVKILSVKGHNSAKICRTWIISPHALLDLWYNICTKFHSNPCKDVGGVEKTNFDATEGRNDGRTEWRNDGRTEWRTKQTLNAPLPFYGGGIKIIVLCERSCHKEHICAIWSPISPGLKIMAKVSFQNFTVKVTNYGTMLKVLSQGIHMWLLNIKALSLGEFKLWPRLKGLSTPTIADANTKAMT